MQTMINGTLCTYNWEKEEWVRIADGEPVSKTEKCDKCKEIVVEGEPDTCFKGRLAGVLNACCGHGNEEYSYVHFHNGETLRGKDAIEFFKKVGAWVE